VECGLIHLKTINNYKNQYFNLDTLLDQIIIYLTDNHLVIIPLLAFFSAALALLTWKQIKQGLRFYFSKRRLIAQLRGGKTLN